MLSRQTATNLLTSARFEGVSEVRVSGPMVCRNMSFALLAVKRQKAGCLTDQQPAWLFGRSNAGQGPSLAQRARNS